MVNFIWKNFINIVERSKTLFMTVAIGIGTLDTIDLCYISRKHKPKNYLWGKGEGSNEMTVILLANQI